MSNTHFFFRLCVAVEMLHLQMCKPVDELASPSDCTYDQCIVVCAVWDECNRQNNTVTGTDYIMLLCISQLKKPDFCIVVQQTQLYMDIQQTNALTIIWIDLSQPFSHLHRHSHRPFGSAFLKVSNLYSRKLETIVLQLICVERF